MGLNISECTHIFSTVSISIVWRIYQFLNGNKIKQTVLQVRFSSTNTYTFTISVFILFLFFFCMKNLCICQWQQKTNKQNYRSFSSTDTYTYIHQCLYLFCMKYLPISQRHQTEQNNVTGPHLFNYYTHTSVSFFICFVWRIQQFLNDNKIKQTMLEDRMS